MPSGIKKRKKMKKLLKKYVFSNEFVLENLSRSCFNFCAIFTLIIIATCIYKTELEVGFVKICVFVVVDILVFTLGIVLDNIKKGL